MGSKAGSGPTGDFVSFYPPDEPNNGSYSYYPAANYLPGTCTNHGPAPPSCPTPFFELGAFAQNDASDHEVESTYNFLILDAGGGSSGVLGDVTVDAANPSPGATTINVPDTVGYAMPHEFGELVRTVCEAVPDHVVISTHCHNDLGLAVSNSLAGVVNGARQVEVGEHLPQPIAA